LFVLLFGYSTGSSATNAKANMKTARQRVHISQYRVIENILTKNKINENLFLQETEM